MAHRMSLLDRVMSKTRPENGCLVWTGALDRDGYGVIQFAGKQCRAPRVAYALRFGPIAPALTVDHLCRNRSCVNPAHLEVVTRKENVLRSNALGALNARKTQCKRGHLLSPDNLYTPRNGQRDCRTCRNDRSKEYRAARRLK